ncbi:acyl CoA binding protein-domain-containing protein [Abortiporus biennis]|nr:acyl CoA binding protein-domain-containing protein [Abortiporus biennis]
MDSNHLNLIDAQFDRAVEIVQGLPKTGPIQTGYEEKLTMYSLYKQATVGNVDSPRPGMFDMLGRAKWDAWAKHKDLDPYAAKQLYVEALLKVLRKYSDKTVARDLVRELDSYNVDPSNLVMSGSLSRSRSHSSSSGSSSSASPMDNTRLSTSLPTHLRNNQTNPSPIPLSPNTEHEEVTSDEDEETDEDVVQSVPLSTYTPHNPYNRPGSSVSSHRYRTPMASMLMTPPTAVPVTQPMPTFETPSAFEGPSPSIPISSYPTTSVSYPGNISHSSRTDVSSPPTMYPTHQNFRGVNVNQRQYSLPSGMTPRPASRPVLERAIENVQAHLAALNERIETLESVTHRSTSFFSQGPRSPGWSGPGRGSPTGRADEYTFDSDDMGMWSLVLKPLSHVIDVFQQLLRFLANNENRSPTLVVIRRLFLDISFLLSVLALVRMTWRKSGMRRKEVLAALHGLWRAIVGHKRPRVLIDRAV